jgi:hypothetical protein
MMFRYAASDIAEGKRKTTTWKKEEGKGNLCVGDRYWICRWLGGVRGKDVLVERRWEADRGRVGERL